MNDWGARVRTTRTARAGTYRVVCVDIWEPPGSPDESWVRAECDSVQEALALRAKLEQEQPPHVLYLASGQKVHGPSMLQYYVYDDTGRRVEEERHG